MGRDWKHGGDEGMKKRLVKNGARLGKNMRDRMNGEGPLKE